VTLLDTIRRWIDGEDIDDAMDAVHTAAQPRRVWEEFLATIAREIEAVMQKEMFTPPGGPTYIPREYLVYLSPDDDKEWKGEKRRGLEQGLYYVLSERARELSGNKKLAVESFIVELRVDGTLNKGEFRVQAIWDSNDTNHTMVMPRVGSLPESPSPLVDEDVESDSTIVRSKPAAFSIEIWRGNSIEATIPVSKQEITIGRGSKSVSVDLPIMGDPEVSRLHAHISRDGNGRYWLTPKGRNATSLNGHELPKDKPTLVSPGDKIGICSFTLKIK
jgi:hypothetical protein